jgi:hypothetical protein
MGRPTGSADLPLHGGRVPAWLAARMARLGRVICEAVVIEYGRDEFLRRLAHPFWFQSFGAVMGMDWHSSGITTSVMGALKRGLEPVSDELGIRVCGGRGRHSRKTPAELTALGERLGLDADRLVSTSKLVAKVDSAAVQDGFELYLHSFVVSDDGRWCVVQQGMNTGDRKARRYHWLSEGLRSFVDEPHSAIEGQPRGLVCNLTDARAKAAREGQVELLRDGPTRVVQTLRKLREGPTPAPVQQALPHLQMPAHHELHGSDVVLRRLHATLAAAAERAPVDFADLLMSPGLGARSVLALAMVAEVIHGAPFRFSDPARFSTALGGKDGHPFPVPLDVYDTTLAVLRRAVERARLGNDDRLAAIRRLDQQARLLDGRVEGPAFDEFVAGERRRSKQFGGRTVHDRPAAAPPAAKGEPSRERTPTAATNQLDLWPERASSRRPAKAEKTSQTR